MRALHRKLGRDLIGSAGTLLSVVAIIAVGTGSFVGLGSAQRILMASQAGYYREFRFADFWIDVKKVPHSAVEQVVELRGIAAIQPRVVFDVILDLPDDVRPISGRLISTPPRNFDKTLNGICLIRGSGFSDDRDEEVILSDVFAQAHGLEPGDRIRLILNRKLESFLIVGTAISPEYVYMVRGAGDIVPDPEHFGVLYVKEDYAREVLDFKDSCNQITGRFVPGIGDRADALLDRIERMLDPYGVLAVTPRERHASHRFLADEIAGLGVSARIMPGIFLLVAALVLNILMTRLAERQRTTIGTLKALGYSSRAVLWHFLQFGIAVGIAGGMAGGLVGILLAIGLVEMYKGFYHFPTFYYQTHPDLLLLALVISVAFALAGTSKGVWAVLRLEPAEAMRSKPPASGGAIFLERFPRLWRPLGFRTHIALRALARNKFRTATGIVSCALATSIILLSLLTYQSLGYLVDFQFEHVAHSDMDIGMRDEQSAAALYEVQALPAVDYAEPLLGLRCDLRNGRHARRMTVTGLSPGHRLTTPVQSDGSEIQLPSDGLVFNDKLAEILDVRVGEHVELTPVRGRRATVRARVASVVEGFLGLEAYADLNYLSRIVGEAGAVNSLQLKIDERARGELYRAIKELPNAQGLSVRADAKRNIEDTLVGTLTFSLSLMILFAGVIAFGSLVNNSLIEMGDRIRDISTFRVLGYRPNQVAAIFFRQNLITFAIGLALSVPLGYGMVVATSAAYDTELYRFPVVFNWETVLWTALISVAFVLIAQWIIYRQIHKLDWLEGIKVKE